MTQIAHEISDMVDMLPEQEQAFALEVIKRLVLAWDADYTKLTPAEHAAALEGRAQFERGEASACVDWDAKAHYA